MLVLLYLLLASGDLFLQKLVRVMPTLGDKKRAVEISHEIQQNISNYLLSVTLINLGLGVAVSGGLYFMGVPNAAMWGVFVAALNFVPYFGPVVRNCPAHRRRVADLRDVAMAGRCFRRHGICCCTCWRRILSRPFCSGGVSPSIPSRFLSH